jgi:hypothetical protein
MANVNVDNILSTFEFPIGDIPRQAPMKNIPLSSLSNFHGMASEDPYSFIFKFDVLYWSYDYTSNSQKLKVFLTTLKGDALRWFMGLGGDSIT